MKPSEKFLAHHQAHRYSDEFCRIAHATFVAKLGVEHVAQIIEECGERSIYRRCGLMFPLIHAAIKALNDHPEAARKLIMSKPTEGDFDPETFDRLLSEVYLRMFCPEDQRRINAKPDRASFLEVGRDIYRKAFEKALLALRADQKARRFLLDF